MTLGVIPAPTGDTGAPLRVLSHSVFTPRCGASVAELVADGLEELRAGALDRAQDPHF